MKKFIGTIKATIKYFLFNYYKYRKEIKIENRKKKLEKEKELKNIEKTKTEILKLQNEYNELIKTSTLDLENKIYEKIRDKKIKDGKLLTFKGFEIELFKKFGFIPKKPKTPILYFGNNREIRAIGLSTEPSITIEMINNKCKQLYTINNEAKNMWFMTGKRVLTLTPNFPMNFDVDLKNGNILCDSETFHNLINTVVRRKLTEPLNKGFDLFGSLKRYWIIILVMVVVYYLYQSGQLQNLIGV